MGQVERRSLRVTFAFLIGVALMPIAIIGSLSALSLWSTEDQKNVEAFERLITERIRDRQQGFRLVTQAVQLIYNMPAVTNGSQPICRTAVAKIVDEIPYILNIIITNQQGDIRCYADIKALPRNVAEKRWFQTAVGFAEPIIVDAKMDDVAGEPPVYYSRSIDRPGDARDQVFVELDRQRLRWLYTQIESEDEAIYNLVNAKLDKIDTYFDNNDHLFEEARPKLQAMLDELRQTGEKVAYRTIFLNGVEYYVGIGTVLEDANYFVGLRPVPVAAKAGFVDYLTQIIIPLFMWALAVVSAWFVIDRFALKWLRRLQWQANWYAAGRLDRDVSIDGAPAEFIGVANTLKSMAQNLKQKNEQLEGAVEEKALLVKEIHHRVKNNLQIITSLINLQASSIKDLDSQRSLFDAQTRINALATVHQALYEVEDVTEVNLRAFLTRLCQQLQPLASSRERQVAIKTDIADAMVNADQAIPLALLITEAVTNSIKHAFVGRKRGTILISVQPMAEGDGMFDVIIRDDGVGKTDQKPADGTTSTGLGSVLIKSFARQLFGELSITFDEAGYATRVSNARLTLK